MRMTFDRFIPTLLLLPVGLIAQTPANVRTSPKLNNAALVESGQTGFSQIARFATGGMLAVVRQVLI